MSDPSQPALNWTALVAACGADESLARTVAGEFSVQVSPQLELLFNSIGSGHTRAALTAAHKLKGSLLAVFAPRAAACVIELETALNNHADTEQLMNQLIIEAELVRRECLRAPAAEPQSA